MNVNRSNAKKNEQFMAYDFFMEVQGGIYPPAVACHVLDLSPSGLFSAAERGKLDFVVFQGRRFYGRKSVNDYRIWHSRKKVAEKKPPDTVCVLKSEKFDLHIEVPIQNMPFLGRRVEKP